MSLGIYVATLIEKIKYYLKNDAKIPHLFTQDRQPKSNYLVIPEVSSINRDYIPIGFLVGSIILSISGYFGFYFHLMNRNFSAIKLSRIRRRFS